MAGTGAALRIIHALPSLARGGGERLMIEFANHEVSNGHSVTVVMASRLAPERELDGLADGVEIRTIAQPGPRWLHYFKLILWIVANRRWIAGHDVVHCHMTFGAVFGTLVRYLLPVMGLQRPAIVETYHAVGMPMPRWHRWVHARMARTRDALTFMVEHDYWRRFAARHPDLRVRIIPAGVSVADLARPDEEQRLAWRRGIGIPDDCEWVVGTVGRLAPERQPWNYVPIFEKLAETLGPKVHFVIGGDGPETERMHALVKSAGLENRVHFLGLVRNLAQPFSLIDLYLTINVGNVTGVAAMQAVAFGLPVMALQLSETYQHGKEDWIWSCRDPLEAAAHAASILADPEARKALIAAQQAYLEANHSVAAMAAAHEDLYRSARANLVAGRS